MLWISSYKPPDQSLRDFVIENILSMPAKSSELLTLLHSAYITPFFMLPFVSPLL